MLKQNKKILLLILVIAVVIAVRFSAIGDMLRIENLKRYRQFLLTVVQDHYLLSIATFIALYIIVAALSIPGAEILTIGGGFLYGVLLTTLYVNIGATIGATLAFLGARYLFGNWLQKKYQRQLSSFNDEMDKNGAHYLLTLRLIPVFPFFFDQYSVRIYQGAAQNLHLDHSPRHHSRNSGLRLCGTADKIDQFVCGNFFCARNHCLCRSRVVCDSSGCVRSYQNDEKPAVKT